MTYHHAYVLLGCLCALISVSDLRPVDEYAALVLLTFFMERGTYFSQQPKSNPHVLHTSAVSVSLLHHVKSIPDPLHVVRNANNVLWSSYLVCLRLRCYCCIAQLKRV